MSDKPKTFGDLLKEALEQEEIAVSDQPAEEHNPDDCHLHVTCSVCGKKDVQNISDTEWMPSFFLGDFDMGEICPQCQMFTTTDGDGETELDLSLILSEYPALASYLKKALNKKPPLRVQIFEALLNYIGDDQRKVEELLIWYTRDVELSTFHDQTLDHQARQLQSGWHPANLLVLIDHIYECVNQDGFMSLNQFMTTVRRTKGFDF